MSAPQRHDVRPRMDDRFDKASQRLKAGLLFLDIFVSIICLADAADDVPHAPLRVIGVDLGAAHETASGTPKVVQLPLLHRWSARFLADVRNDLVQPLLGLREPAESLLAICRGKYEALRLVAYQSSQGGRDRD